MSREILFKAKRANWRELPKEEWWVEGNLVWSNDSFKEYQAIIIPKENSDMFTKSDDDLGFENWYLVDPETVCQYTGLTNKDGRKIYEGDIVMETTSGYIGVIKIGNYELKHYGFYIDWIKDYGYRRDICFWVTNRFIRTIGNIFDNFEFLKDGQQSENPITYKEEGD